MFRSIHPGQCEILVLNENTVIFRLFYHKLLLRLNRREEFVQLRK